MNLDHVLSALNADAGPVEARQHRLYRLLKTAILEGTLVSGSRLPSTRQLAVDYGMARNGVLHAWQQLLAEGFIVAGRNGSRVADLPTHGPAGSPSAVHSSVLSRRATQGQTSSRHEVRDVLPFTPGVPDLNAFPWRIWAGFLQRAWGQVSARQLAYAVPGGEPALRHSVATWLRARRGVVCTPEQVFIVAGGQVAFDACARLLADPGDTVWLENPGYPAVRRTLQAAGLHLQAVDVDAEGMAPPPALWLEQPPQLIYLTPSHQYPLGSVLSLERRLNFLQKILQQGKGWLIEDDYDSEFQHAGQGRSSLPAIQGLLPDAPVIYVGTFSKMLYPGLRIAYMVVPRAIAPSFGEAIEGLYRSGQAVEQRALASFIESGRLTRHLRQMAPVYRARQACLRSALQENFGASAEILGGAAGLHLTLSLPDGPADHLIRQWGSEFGLALRPLSPYYTTNPVRNGLVLGYGMAEEARIPELIARLGDVIRLIA